jgi:uncharacterized protein
MRRRIIAAIVAVLGFPASVLVAGEVLSLPAHESVGQPPSDLHAASVEIRTDTGQLVSGWMVRGTPGVGAVLLLHGARADRREMLGRARFLRGLGYSVLLIDLPAHGESAGAHKYGLAEAQGVAAALSYLSHELPSEKIGVIGVSLGAASLVLSKPKLPLSAVVLESMFPTLREAVSDRLSIYLGPLGEPLTPLLLWQLALLLDIFPDQLRPIAELPSLHAPLLIAAGSIDRYTTLEETQRIYAAASEPKELWVVNGAAHVDLHAFASKVYEARVSAFLAKHLHA